MDQPITRRQLLQDSAAGALGLGLATSASLGLAQAAEATTKPAPSERIVLGFIGVGGMGQGNLRTFQKFPDVEIAAVCDVYEAHRENARSLAGGKPEGYADFRRVLDRKDIDAVVISTPDHWHALPTILACQAGKDVYIEKPLAHSIGEGRAMVKAAHSGKRVTQMGNLIHATENYHRVVEIVRSGMLGKISTARVWLARNEAPGGIGKPADSDPPPGLDWDFYLGPAPKRPFNRNRFIFNFRYFWDYAGGMLTDFACHIMDPVFWALGLEAPTAVTAMGGRYVLDDNGETPDTLEVAYQFPGGFQMVWSNTDGNAHGFDGRRMGIMFCGTKGTLAADYGSYTITPEGDRLKGVDEPPPSLPRSPGHHREWLDALKSRRPCSCDVEYGHKLTTAALLGNISLRVGRQIRWNAAQERIVNDAGANAYLTREYRAPWTLPT